MLCDYINNNYIPEFLVANSVVVEGEFLLEWCEYFGQPQTVVHQLCTTVWAFYPRWESVTCMYVFHSIYITNILKGQFADIAFMWSHYI